MTPSDPATHQRHSIRLKGYDYTRPGAYFVTMVTFQRLCLFGEVVGETMRLNAAGRIVCAEWLRLERVFANIQLGAFVVMPNHVHGIIVINGTRSAIL
jgi:REP element-mobilizing transposase RayT